MLLWIYAYRNEIVRMKQPADKPIIAATLRNQILEAHELLLKKTSASPNLEMLQHSFEVQVTLDLLKAMQLPEQADVAKGLDE